MKDMHKCVGAKFYLKFLTKAKMNWKKASVKLKS